MADVFTGESTELLQAMIRNECVNEGTIDSGNEVLNAQTLRDYLDGSGVEIELYEAAPGRVSIVGKLEGTDPTAPTLMLMGHTDVVPVNPDGWTFDPFGGELVNGRIYGRGAIDMLNMTSSMAVAIKHLASQKRLRGSVVFAGVADEEMGGNYGARYLLENERDAVNCDYLITERGGVPLPGVDGLKLGVRVGEKGFIRHKLKVRGTPGHASMPYATDNALTKAARVITRLEQHEIAPKLEETWKKFVDAMGYEDELRERLLDPAKFDDALDELPVGLAKIAHACMRTTMTPTVIHGGTKSNVIPDYVEIQVDVRTTVGEDVDSVRTELTQALGDLASEVEIEPDLETMTLATRSPADTPLWDVLQKVSAQLIPGAVCVPKLAAPTTDASYFRTEGIPSYGFALFSPEMQFDEFIKMFHGNDEWVDQESLRLSTELWKEVALQFLA